MPNYVCKGAKLKCSMGDSNSELDIIHPLKPVFMQGNNVASIMDYKPMVNIKPFGKCKSLANPIVASATAANYGVLRPMPCIPNTVSPWMKGKIDSYIKGQQALMDDCKLNCVWAGIIEVSDDGQKP